ncbi:MAG TPA: GntR family transcriptional regulator [Verrucomicrobiae bacterium]|jgi:LacI family transcriptional regulator|nr:GntR family transcriptional regulator [Verrucomicrobiae bacterium]
MKSPHKHSEISRHLLTEIAAGKYSASDRLPSETQLVKQFKVSRPTVARALRDLMAEGIIERRAGSGTFVSQKGVRAETRQIGLLIPGLATTEIFQIICGEIASLARVHDYGLFWGGSPDPLQDRDDSLGHAQDLCQQFIRRKLSGVFFAPVEWHPGQKEANLHLAEMLRDAGIPVVLLDRDISEFPQRSNFDLVGIDNMAGGYLLAEHLIKLGCRHIYFVAHPLSAPTVDARIAGWREALVRHRIEPEPNWVQTGDPTDIKFVRSLVAARRADAFVCARDDTAAMLMRSMENIGARVPQHFRVVGFDDVKYATLVSVPLTTIHQPCREIAMIAFRTMLERVAEPTLPPRTISLMPHLVVRESCGAYLPRSLPAERSGKSKRLT